MIALPTDFWERIERMIVARFVWGRVINGAGSLVDLHLGTDFELIVMWFAHLIVRSSTRILGIYTDKRRVKSV